MMDGIDPQLFDQRRMLSLDSILKQSEAINLDDLEGLLDPQGKAELSLRQAPASRFAASIPAYPYGRDFLYWLREITIDRPFSVRGMSIEQAALYAQMREGQNTVAHSIFKLVRAGEELLMRERG